MTDTTDTKFYLNQLKSEECLCGDTKQRRRSFCYHCYKALTYDLQKGLWKKIRDGYEEAYEEAAKYLKEEVY